MNKIFVGMIAAAGTLLASCSDQYHVTGTTSMHGMEGKTLYLKTFVEDDMKTLDSCSVTHGKFKFSGVTDSTLMANLFLGNEGGMPVVLEGGNVTIKLDELEQTVTGSPLNDSLYAFIHRKNVIDSKIAELPNREGHMVMDGMDHDEVVRLLSIELNQLMAEQDALETAFIKQNFDNVLGPGVFMIMTSNYRFPVMTPQIEELLVNATPYFLNHPYVAGYLKAARENEDILREQ